MHAEKLKSGKIPDKEEFKKRVFKEERDFFMKKLEEAKETLKLQEIEIEELFKNGQLNKKEIVMKKKVNLGVVKFYEEKLRRVEHDLWISNKNKYDLIKFPVSF